MDVTNGLISRLVKSKSTERVLAPIASQVSLLMILNEVQHEHGNDTAESSALSVFACVDKVTKAVDGFIRVAQDQIHHSSDPVFDSQMGAACETLDLAKTQLYVAGQNLTTGRSASSSNAALVTAAKHLLQAVLRVLVVVDDVEVRRCVQSVATVETKVRNIRNITSSREMVSAFKELSEAVLYMITLISHRQKDLVSRHQAEQLVAGLNLIRKGASSLKMSVQTYLKYPSNPQAIAGMEQVVDRAVSTLADMRSILENGLPPDIDSEEAGHFVDHVDKVLSALAKATRWELNPDIESWVASLVRHAMGVAILCQGSYRHLITRSCQRILQSKCRLFELHESVGKNPHLSAIRLDYEGLCELLLDEFCELEKHVNMALLHLIVDTCCLTSQPLEQLATAALHPVGDLDPDVAQWVLVKEFNDHGDMMCHIAAMASASSMDPKKVRAVRLAASRLEQLQPELVPAVAAVCGNRGNAASIRQLKSLVQEWEKESEALVQAFDSMTDPAVFLQVTEQRLRHGVNAVRARLAERDSEGLRVELRRLLGHARRMVQVATRVVDHHRDPIFRNGLMVFIHQLESARRGIKDAGYSMLEDLNHVRVVDTLHRRLGLLLDAGADLRQGLIGDNHVDLLNPAREKVRRQHLLSDQPTREERLAEAERDSRHEAKPNPHHAQAVASVLDRLISASTQTMPSAQGLGPVCQGQDSVGKGRISPTLAAACSVGQSAMPEGRSKGQGHDPEGKTRLDDASVSNLPTAVVKVAGDCAHEGEPQTAGREPERTRGEPQRAGREPQRAGRESQRAGRNTGETTALLEFCGDSLVTSAMSGDRAEVSRWASDMLSWTSHLGEMAQGLADHCHHAGRKSEMHQATVEMDRLAPLVIEAARFVAAGDKGQTSSLRLLTDEWFAVCDKLRIMVDVGAGDWLLLMEPVWQAVARHDTHRLKLQLALLDRNHREMNLLLGRVRSMEGQHIDRWPQLAQFFADSYLELDSLTATVKTTADCGTCSGDRDTVSQEQLLQRGREWCVLMACLEAEFTSLSETLGAAGQARLGVPVLPTRWTAGTKVEQLHSKAVLALQAETARLREMLGCLAIGKDETPKQRCEELHQGLGETVAEVREVVQTVVDDVTFPQAKIFAQLDAGLACCRWMEKALTAEQLVHERCLRFATLVSGLAFSASQEGADGVPPDLTLFQSKLKVVTQRALQAIQLSSDIKQRGAVRSYLDDLSALLTAIRQALSRSAVDVERERQEREGEKLADLWGSKVHGLLATMAAMEEVKPSLVNELDRYLCVQPWDASAPTPPLSSVPPRTTPARPQSSLHHTTPAGPQSRTLAWSPSVAGPASTSPQSRAVRSHRSVTAEEGGGGGQQGERSGVRSAVQLAKIKSDTRSDDMSPYRRSALYASWLASAQYLGEEVCGWEDVDNRFVRLVHTMAQRCQQMADFARGGTSFKDSSEVGKTGVALANDGTELEKFAQCLMAMTPANSRQALDLKDAADKIATCTRQLHIISSMLQNTLDNAQGDCILARNAANLVDAIRTMFSVAESVSVAGCLEHRGEDSSNEFENAVVDLLHRWQRKLILYHLQQTSVQKLDELGLRRVETHNPPSLSSLLNV